MKKKFVFFAFLVTIFLFSLSFTGCAARNLKKINLEEVSSMGYKENWAVITSPYTTFYEKPVADKNSIKHGRKGDIYKICGKKIVQLANNEQDIWYKFDDGWVYEKDLYICNNKLQAQKFSKSIIEQ